jgi:hypothetical protein
MVIPATQGPHATDFNIRKTDEKRRGELRTATHVSGVAHERQPATTLPWLGATLSLRGSCRRTFSHRAIVTKQASSLDGRNEADRHPLNA